MSNKIKREIKQNRAYPIYSHTHRKQKGQIIASYREEPLVHL